MPAALKPKGHATRARILAVAEPAVLRHGFAGTSLDHLWRMNDGIPTSTQLTINGNYILVPGYFGTQPEGSPQKRLIFYSQTAADHIWTFAPGDVSVLSIDFDARLQPNMHYDRDGWVVVSGGGDEVRVDFTTRVMP